VLFSRFGVEKRIIDKQFDAVVDVLDRLRRFHIFLYNKTGGVAIRPLAWRLNKEVLEGFKGCRIVVGVKMINMLNVLGECADDVYVPPSVAAKLAPFSVSSASRSSDFEAHLESSLLLINENKTEFLGDELNGRIWSLEEFVGLFDELVVEIQNWLAAHSDADVPLNIPRDRK